MPRSIHRRFSSSIHRWVALATSVVALLSATSPAHGADAKPEGASAGDAGLGREAKDLARAGIAHYRAGRLEEARAAFAKAWSLKPSSELAASLAEVEMRLDRYSDAAEHWTYYIQNLPPDRTEAEYQLAECRRHLGSVRVAVDTPGAVVSLDGKVLGPAPLRADLWVSPGAHVFEARVAERTPATQRIAIGPGEAQLVSLMLAGANAPEPALGAAPVRDTTPHAAPTHGGGSTAKTVVLVSGTALALAGVGVGIGFTLKSNNAGDEVEAILTEFRNAGATSASWCAPSSGQTPPPRCADYSNAVNERNEAKAIAIASFAAGGAFAVGTVLTAWLWHVKPGEQVARAPAVTVTRADRHGAFVTVTGSF